MRIYPIIVPLYYSHHLIDKFISAVELESNKDLYKIIFIDNTWNYEKPDQYITDLNNKINSEFQENPDRKGRMLLYSAGTNLYYSKAVNVGFQLFFTEYKCDWIEQFLIMNPDCFPAEKDWLTRLVSIWDEISYTDNNICTLGTTQYYDDNMHEIWHAGCMWKESGERKVHELDWKHLQTPIPFGLEGNNFAVRPVDGNTGTGIMIDRKAFRKLGMFDEIKYHHYSGDADFCLRASERGYTHYCCNVPMIHNPGNSCLKDNLTLVGKETIN